ncbi:hypothetical protein [Streptomyces sp. NPDC002054]|uniref:hypothetical protein n=1 Tax=Streptomyces sp. NPDC002054 TaxID=3154663 RepID=UPI00331834BA
MRTKSTMYKKLLRSVVAVALSTVVAYGVAGGDLGTTDSGWGSGPADSGWGSAPLDGWDSGWGSAPLDGKFDA